MPKGKITITKVLHELKQGKEEVEEGRKFEIELVRAGQPVFIRINPEPTASKTHEIISSDGSMIGTENVLWHEGWNDVTARLDKVKQMIRRFKGESESIQKDYERRTATWIQDKRSGSLTS